MSLKGLRLWRGCIQQQLGRSTAYRQLSQSAVQESGINQKQSPQASPKPFKDIPGPRGYPLIGTALDYAGKNANMYTIFRNRYDKYGAIYREKLFPGMPEQIVIFDPDDVETVFRADGEWPNRPEGGEVFKKIREEAGLDPGILQL